MKIKLYGTYMMNEGSVMCIGIDSEAELAVFASFYADDEDGTPELHVEDGIAVINLLDTENLLQLSPYKLEPQFKLTANLVGFTDEV
ncbi:hypothetical protein [Paenibacillus medicaginis]|uniref:Uncharacterized protein n=1 Tax=Paenibacillus medicaginis TaxID=1470560 RepID=A0ABV5BUY7_9BACL